ncbi:hypothetical protein Tco_1337956 [Tanacetum coccineum]
MRSLEEQTREDTDTREYHRQKGNTTMSASNCAQLIDNWLRKADGSLWKKNIKEGKDKQRSGGKNDALETSLTPSYGCKKIWPLGPATYAALPVISEQYGALRQPGCMNFMGGCVRTLAKKPRYLCMGTETHDGCTTIDHRTQVENPTRILPSKAEKTWASSRARYLSHSGGGIHKHDGGRYSLPESISMIGSPTSYGQKREHDSWRTWVLVDFTDLNKDVPKPAITPEKIDGKVKSYAGWYPSSASWDAYKGYHRNPNGQGLT